MSLRKLKWAALASIFAVTQLACYNTYTIDNNELSKLEASVDRYEVVEVLADCPDGVAPAEEASHLHGTMWADAQVPGDDDAVSDAVADEVDEAEAADSLVRRIEVDDLRGCTMVPVSTVNALTVLTRGGGEQRVTPFNFVMDDVQLVSPEYDVLVQLDQVEGAEVSDFSGWKTAAAITGMTVVTVGTFVGIGLLSDSPDW